MSEPQRTCVGCRGRGDRSRLLRVVVGKVAGESRVLLPDPPARAAGRGAWLHHDLQCLSTALRRRAFGRALRVQGELDASGLTAYLEAAVRDTSTTA